MKSCKVIGSALLMMACFMAVMGSVAAQDNKPVDSAYANNYYKERLEVFSKMPHTKNAIVFLGNSITEAGKWQEILPGKMVINRGISGDNSFGVLARLPQILMDKPARIFLMIGVNDLKREVPVQVIIENYKRMVAMIRKESPKTKLYLQSVLPVNDSMLIEPFRKVTNSDVQKLNEALKILARQKNNYYVNLHEIFADEKGQLKKDETPDGLHLKIPSYVAWVNYLQQNKFL